MGYVKLGAGTYAFRDVDVFEILPRVRRIGYEAIEILAGEGWATAPACLNRDDRSRLSDAIREQGFDSPALMALLPLCEEGRGQPVVDAEFRAVCRLARDLSSSDAPTVLSSPIGHQSPPWDSGRTRIADRLVALADIAQEHGVILAVEPHVGNPLDSPEKAVWLMEQTSHPALRLNFDISHFHVQAMDVRQCIEACLPYAAHIHVKDGYIGADGEVVFQLPGEGRLDLGEYFRILAEHNSTIPVTAEVSAMIWRRPDYDPWAAAEQSFAALDSARRSAGS